MHHGLTAWRNLTSELQLRNQKIHFQGFHYKGFFSLYHFVYMYDLDESLHSKKRSSDIL